MGKFAIWYKKYSIHAILAALITVGGVGLTGYLATEKINDAKLIESVLPQMISKDPREKKAALFVIRTGASAETMSELARQLMGSDYTIDIIKAREEGDKEREKELWKEAQYIGKEVYDAVDNGLRQYQEKIAAKNEPKAPVGKQLPCVPLVLYFDTTSGPYEVLADNPNCKINIQ